MYTQPCCKRSVFADSSGWQVPPWGGEVIDWDSTGSATTRPALGPAVFGYRGTRPRNSPHHTWLSVYLCQTDLSALNRTCTTGIRRDDVPECQCDFQRATGFRLPGLERVSTRCQPSANHPKPARRRRLQRTMLGFPCMFLLKSKNTVETCFVFWSW